jgi:[acyl-carrier-protein] S-malonyltransferase
VNPVTLAILCSGQGLQRPDMFFLTANAAEAEEVYVHATRYLGGRDPRELVRNEDTETLHRNKVAQIVCVSQALAMAAALRDAWPARMLVAGYSVGEVAAWSVSGLINAAVTLDLVARRAEIMDAAAMPGDGLISVRGLSRTAIDEMCVHHSVAIAIVNPSESFVLGGEGEALARLAAEAKARGAVRVTRIAVNVASHTPRLAAASAEFRKALQSAPIKSIASATARLFSGIDGTAVRDTAVGKDKLAAQIAHTVEWASCLEGCVEAGANAFLELGPGTALSKMVADVYPEIPSRSCEDFRSLEGVRAWCAYRF